MLVHSPGTVYAGRSVGVGSGLVGIDLGGTKIEAMALGEDGEVLLRPPVPKPVGSYRGTLRAVAHLVRDIESFRSGPGLSRDCGDSTGRVLDPPGKVQGAEHGDEQAVAALTRYEERTARGLAHVINVLDPDVVVAGSGMKNVQLCTVTCRHCEPITCSQTVWTRAWFHRGTEIPAGWGLVWLPGVG